MNGAQDLGGQMGHGPVMPEKDEPIFHAPWERTAMALVVAMGPTGVWNLDKVRHTRESLPPAVYLNASYYEIWMRALQALVLEHGLASPEELETGWSLGPGRAVKRVLKAEEVAEVLAKGTPYARPCSDPGGRPRALPQRPSGDAYADAALRARRRGRGGREPRQLRLPGYERPWRGREPDLVLRRPLPRRGPLGQGRGPGLRGDGRPVGALS
jgi:nitrile hydratase subunit beta